MENFIVSARKYRPMTFDTVIGQPSITATLKNAIKNNQIAQAFLFCGPRGVGKTTCARILAKTINCTNLTPESEACNSCESCLSFNESASFNMHELDAASNNSVDDIRNLVDQVRVPPQGVKYKVYIIDEVHMLSQQAFNAFLKTLEEPPAYAKFILATTEKHKIIPTILSRCQVFDFKRITVEDIARHLKYVAGKEGIDASEDALHIIAQKADGALRDALSIFDQLVSFAGNKLTYDTVIHNLNILDYEYYFRITDQILKKDTPAVLLTINEIIDNGFEGQHFLNGMGGHLRNLLVSKDPSTISLLEVSPGLKEKYLRQSMACSADFLLKALDINNQCDLNYKISNNKNLHLELALLQMCSIGNTGQSSQAQQPELPVMEKEAGPEKASREPKNKVEEPPPPSGTRVAKTGKKIPGTLSIKQAVNGELERAAVQENAVQANGAKELPEEPFTQEDLEKAWVLYTQSIVNDSPNLYSTLTKRKPRLKEEQLIVLEIDNKVQEREIREKRADIHEYLRRELSNYKLRLETSIPENHEQSKAYFPEEIYQKMAEKNPNIKKLKDQLDMEIDY
jgi:DNA polymerase-3 subunit gamma/tau